MSETDVVLAATVEPTEGPAVEGDLDADLGGPAELELNGADELRGALEAVLFVCDSPIPAASLAAALQQPQAAVQAALQALGEELQRRGAGVELRQVAGGYRLYTRDAYAPAVEQFLRDGQRTRLTQAALETLAVIAYRQPVTRGRVSAIRGVNVDGVARTLLSRGLIAEVGSDPETGGGLYATTDLFLEKLGLSGLDELPSLAPLLPDVGDLDEFDGFSGEN
ncbi:MAG: SMC-Scp complex subunit ScpB [Jatrophihabitans sp.]